MRKTILYIYDIVNKAFIKIPIAVSLKNRDFVRLPISHKAQSSRVCSEAVGITFNRPTAQLETSLAGLAIKPIRHASYLPNLSKFEVIQANFRRQYARYYKTSASPLHRSS